MENSKLIALLKTFSTKELREFNEFVSSPFFNKNEELMQFNEILRKLAPDFQPKKIEREKLFSKMYPGKAYDDKQLNYLMSFTLKLAEQYIGYTQFKKDEIQEKVQILSAYNDRDLEKHYQFIHNQVTKQLEQHPYRNMQFYYLQFLTANISNDHFLKQKIRKYDDRLQMAADHLDQFYLARKLRYCCEMLDRKLSIAADYELHFIDEVVAYVEQNPDMRTPSVAVYYTVLMMLQGAEQEHFRELKRLIVAHREKFPQADLKDIYGYAINFCIRKVNNGDQSFLEELFNTYNEALEDGTLLEDDRLSPWAYKNIIGVGLRLRLFDRTEQFIREYNGKLAPEFRDNALNYNLAELKYYQGQPDDALAYLNRVEFSDIYYTLDTKKMMLKIYYEQEEIDALYSLISSFKMYLKRTKLVSANNRAAYQNFVQVLSLMIKHDPKYFDDIAGRLKDPEPLGDRQWLTKAYEKLSGKVLA